MDDNFSELNINKTLNKEINPSNNNLNINNNNNNNNLNLNKNSNKDISEKEKEEKISNLMKEILLITNPEANEEIKNKTPLRFAKALIEFTSGYNENINDILNDAIFPSDDFKELIIIKDINFVSTCEHHMLPFFGDCIIGYIPNNKILGLSKFPRIVNSISKKFHLQERLTKDIANTLNEYLEPLGIIVLINASHSCMCFRGVRSWGSKTQTIYKLGCLKNKEYLNEFFNILNYKN
jgi:GTP cyclohydrolase I